MKRKLNKKKVVLSIIIILLLIIIPFSIIYFNKTYNTDIQNVSQNEIIVENIIEPVEEETNEVNITKEEEFVPITMYTTTGVNMRDYPSLESTVIKVLPINTEVLKVNNIDEKWSMIQYKDSDVYYYIYTQYLSIEKTKIEQPITSRGGSIQRTSTQGVLTKSKGVNYFNGHKETWYSQKVLPGGGLKIPGRHVAADGTIRDENDYICVASSDYPKGTIVETSLGTGKVYDSGCASGTIDIYTNW